MLVKFSVAAATPIFLTTDFASASASLDNCDLESEKFNASINGVDGKTILTGPVLTAVLTGALNPLYVTGL